MPRRSVSPRRLAAAVAILSIPLAAVMLVLVVGGQLAVLPALGAMVVSTVLMTVVVLPFLRDIATVSAWTREMADGVDAGPPPPPRSEKLMDETVGAVAQLRRAWQQRQAELAAAARWNEALFDALPVPLVLLDDTRRVTHANLAARQVFGRDIGGRDMAAVLRDPQVLEATDEVLAGARGREAEFTLPVPVERCFRVLVERVDAASADGTRAILALHDLTTVRRMEQMRADFVANASHELRTPLATLLGFIETLRGPARDDAEARDRFLGIMHEQAGRMSRLVNDLLSLSRIELNEHFQPSETVDLGRLVVGQEDELAQLVQNLLDNAVKYGRDGTPVEVSLSATTALPAAAGAALRAGAVVLSVRDHGEGIAKEHLPRLTERFYRVDTARSRKLGGTGLGLAIVKHIVNRHRGTLVVESDVGVGSTFSVYLPAAEDAGQTARAAG
ncbi:MAG: ATP-binding protein [Pseudomonadota bacterium]